MKSITALILVFILSAPAFASKPDQTINALIGDISFVSTFGFSPNQETDETLRIKTHLAFVENLLRSRSTEHLTKKQKNNRKKMLDLLHDYRTAEAFPSNHDYENQRRPCFIDDEGNICAVGYLVEQTAGYDAAALINEDFKYEYVMKMESEALVEWVEQSGLSVEECAMIQPTYGWVPPPTNQSGPIYRGFTAVWTGANTSLNAISGIQMIKKNRSPVVPIIGLGSGIGQLTFGIVEYWDQGQYFTGSGINHSLLNIGMGTGTILLNLYALISNRMAIKKDLPRYDNKTSFNLYSVPMNNDKMAVGLMVTHKF